MSSNLELKAWRELLEAATAGEILRWAACMFPGRVTFATSLGAEDQVLTQMLADQSIGIPIFMLDTGRLFEEHYQLLARTRETYGLSVQLYFPATKDVEEAVNRKGPNYFRQSVELRKHCCTIRKVKPLQRALAGQRAWITGLRRGQGMTREGIQVIEWDHANGLWKINPLWSWDEDRVWAAIREHQIPYNPLHDQGFPSIGCAPCTRAVLPGEDQRAGRWWWERPESRECGLHFSEDGRLIPSRALKSETADPRAPQLQTPEAEASIQTVEREEVLTAIGDTL